MATDITFAQDMLKHIAHIASSNRNQFIDEVCRIQFQHKLLKNDEKGREVLLSLREYCKKEWLSKGDIFDETHFCLWSLFQSVSLEKDCELTQNIVFFENYLNEKNSIDHEWSVILSFLFVLYILNGESHKGLIAVTKRLMRSDMRSFESAKFLEDYQNFLHDFYVEKEACFGALDEFFLKKEFEKLTSLERRSICNWTLHFFWPVYKTIGINSYFLSYQNEFFYLIKVFIEKNALDELLYFHFFSHFVLGNLYQTQEEMRIFNDHVDYPASEYYALYSKKHNLTTCKKNISSAKIKIGFIKEYIVMNSPFKVEYSLFKALLNNEEFTKKYEIVVYTMNYFEKSDDSAQCIKMLLDLGIEIVNPSWRCREEEYYYSHLTKAISIRESIIKDDIDILIALTNNFGVLDFIFSTRSAPKQIFWSHGNGEWNIIGIDKRITHCILNNSFLWENFSIPMDVEQFYNPPVNIQDLANERAKYPENVTILGTIGRLIKVDSDEYLEVVAKIMRDNPTTIYIAAGAGNMDVIRAKVEELGISERFFMPGFVNPHIYGHIIDIFLDTFPLGQGESLYEFMHKNSKSFITLKDQSYLDACHRIKDVIAYKVCENKEFAYIKGLLESKYQEQLHLLSIAFSVEDYILKLIHIIEDNVLRKAISEYFLKIVHFDDDKILSNFLNVMIEES